MRTIYLLLLVSACSLDVDYAGTHYQCNPDGTCPSGYACLDMVCVPTDPVPPACSKDVSSGGGHSCAVREDGSVWCWGQNDYGQLGDGTAIDSDIPVQVEGLTRATKVGAGDLFSCALDDMGQVFCWGNNSQGQLGDGTTSDSRSPVQVGDVIGATRISIGSDHACVMRGDSTIACWGSNDDGQLGDGSTTQRSAPTVVMLPGPARHVSTGHDTTCVALMDGSAYCWGENNDGELGVGDTMQHTRPTVVVGVADVTAVAAGDDFSCFLSELFVFCAGLNDDGQLGNGSVMSSSRPVPTQMPVTATALEAGARHACALDGSGNTWCWGAGSSGRLLDRSTQRRLLPVRGLENVETVSAGSEHTCALDATGAVRCAGFNRRGQLGDGRAVTSGRPVVVDGVENAVAVVAGGHHSCAVQMDGRIYCWGLNEDGQVGAGTFIPEQTVPREVVGIVGPDQMIAGFRHTCAMLPDSSTYCWGYNGDGRLGDGTQTTAAHPRPVNVFALPSSIAAGDNATCAIVPEGARCWGSSFDSSGTTITGIIGITAGSGHVCKLEPDRTVTCYGVNDRNQLGDGTSTMQGPPGVTAIGVTNAAAVYARGEQSCARMMDGTVKCWGLNADGRLGVGSTNYTIATPTSVMGLSDVTKLAMGWDASCAIKSDGTLWCWGANYFGQVGDGSYQSRSSPVQLPGITGVKDVASGVSHTCAIDGNGQVVCWGLGIDGQLGNGIREISRPVGVRMTCPAD